MIPRLGSRGPASRDNSLNNGAGAYIPSAIGSRDGSQTNSRLNASPAVAQAPAAPTGFLARMAAKKQQE